MVTEAKIRANNKYNKAHSVVLPIRLNKTTDADILARLEQVPSKAGYIKELIREDILMIEERESE